MIAKTRVALTPEQETLLIPLYAKAQPEPLCSLTRPGGLDAFLFFIRTALEDKTFQAELDGYQDYAARVRYRLLPGVW